MTSEACLSLSLKGLEAEQDFEKEINGLSLYINNTKK